VGLLLIDCCLWISLAMSTGLVSILLCSSAMQSRGGVSWFLKILLLIFFGLFSYSCRYLVIVFLTQSWVYLVVMLRACVFAILAILHGGSLCKNLRIHVRTTTIL
jgi:hypothetical protein